MNYLGWMAEWIKFLPSILEVMESNKSQQCCQEVFGLGEGRGIKKPNDTLTQSIRKGTQHQHPMLQPYLSNCETQLYESLFYL